MNDSTRNPTEQPVDLVRSSRWTRALPAFRQLQRWSASDLSDLPQLNVTILRNVVVDQIVPYLRYLAFQEGFNAVCRMGEYDNIMQEATGATDGLLDAATDCVLVFPKLETLAPRLAYDFAELSAEQIKAEVELAAHTLKEVVAGIRRQTSALILLHSFELPLHPSFGTLDTARRRSGQSGAIQSLNELVVDTLQEFRNAFSVDMNRCVARVGASNFYDTRYWQVARAPYTLQALAEIASEDFKYLRALKGKARKCVVLDCDGVLWGGIVGEDGLPGIKLGTTFPGSCFRDFQKEVVNLYRRGVLIALCSKNNADDVWEVFDRHPEMVLKRDHIAAFRINWQDKATNLSEIAEQLNIGIDSLVMVDDSEFELDLIERTLPSVTLIHLPAERPSDYPSILAACGLFDTLTLSEEDRSRGAAYKAEAARAQMRTEAVDLDGFLRSLQIELDIRLADDFALPRIAQLTQKTNQFNLTTRRYSDEDIRRFRDAHDADVLYVRYRDRFGDAGIVGVCIVRYESEVAIVDSLLLSCRVLGRKVERVFLAHVLARAAQRGAATLIGDFLPTAKNMQVERFYPENGFSMLQQRDQATSYSLDLRTTSFDTSDWLVVATDVVQSDPVHSHASEG